MAENRTERSLVGRDADTRERKVRQWRPAATLPDPTPQPGYVFRWIRNAILGQADPTNMSGKLREGWEPVRAEDHPEMMLEASKSGNLEIGGLVLCKAPEELTEQRNAYYNKQAKAQMDSVDNTLFRESDPRMPIFKDHESKVSRGGFGSGSSKP
jgi:hypothetical protein